jgi:hypothetical protein
VEIIDTIGFVGAFSTSSAIGWGIFANLQIGAFFIAALYVALSLIIGLAAEWCGVLAARMSGWGFARHRYDLPFANRGAKFRTVQVSYHRLKLPKRWVAARSKLGCAD